MDESDYADYPVDAPDQREDAEALATEPERTATRATRTWVVSRAGIAEAHPQNGAARRTEGAL
ncbi:hypothetical protein ACFOSC_09365 [Streptantibioticus rubrisoli]|uniref:Uncharacterized protein n=1 Tax=Streptantibioticus rubrisoli TaxID=1387313 RepID=A0ABT1P9J6_9ACTN|nr:hypothetical protein [Streptantibioticus rubrisoli]MCQ4040918.1 hypothetical protein [Streptantibioticus rubrisoli]